jgi:hypothetical protein
MEKEKKSSDFFHWEFQPPPKTALVQSGLKVNSGKTAEYRGIHLLMVLTHVLPGLIDYQ